MRVPMVVKGKAPTLALAFSAMALRKVDLPAEGLPTQAKSTPRTPERYTLPADAALSAIECLTATENTLVNDRLSEYLSLDESRSILRGKSLPKPVPRTPHYLF